jgi:lipopolysaccharide/colanic/teichoic acid biosynthesis glycosyltransferase
MYHLDSDIAQAETGASTLVPVIPTPLPPLRYLPGVVAAPVRLSPLQRVLDLALLTLLLPLLLPLGIAISIVVFIDSPGSIFYRAERIGLGARPFRMLKFRTMRSDSTGAALTRNGDDRFTPVGRFLARTRLDELPQLWHVLTGEMRMVGPRPEDPAFVYLFARQYREILQVPPGITGEAQLVHFDDALEFDETDPLAHYAQEILLAKLHLDADYVRDHSIRRDLGIIARTLMLPLHLVARGTASGVAHHRPHSVLSVALVGLLLIAFAAVGGPAR